MGMKYVLFPVPVLEELGIQLNPACIKRKGPPAIECCFQIPASALQRGKCYRLIGSSWRKTAAESLVADAQFMTVTQVNWVPGERGQEAVAMILD